MLQLFKKKKIIQSEDWEKEFKGNEIQMRKRKRKEKLG
jgi:hypothetical protein